MTGAEIGYSGQRIECSGGSTTQGNKGIEGRLQGANERKEGAGSTIKQDGLQRINGVHIVRPFLFAIHQRHFLRYVIMSTFVCALFEKQIQRTIFTLLYSRYFLCCD